LTANVKYNSNTQVKINTRNKIDDSKLKNENLIK